MHQQSVLLLVPPLQPLAIYSFKKNSLADPYPIPNTDPYDFKPPGSGSGSISQRYGSRSGSFYHQAKIVRKTSIPTALCFC
jgi:hypothetical protein